MMHAHGRADRPEALTGSQARECLGLLVRGELGPAAKPGALRPGDGPALVGALDDALALRLGDAR